MKTIRVRQGIESDAEGMSRVHFEAVHGTASSFYSSEIIESWTRRPDERRQEQFRRAISGGEELFVVAESEDGILGFGSLAPASQEVRAIYVDPRFGRRGVGSSILQEIERLAQGRGIRELCLDSSVNAEAFYAQHGYAVVERGVHRLSSGTEMACVRMRKSLAKTGESARRDDEL